MLSDEEIRRIAKAEVDLHYDAHGLAKNKRYEQDVQRQTDAFKYAVAIFRNAGYSIVPNEPTEAMVEAGTRTRMGTPYNGHMTTTNEIYRVMLAAAKGDSNGYR
jgi:hypothetical protein